MANGSARASWYVLSNGQVYGPYDAAQMAGLVRDGKVSSASPVCRVGAREWAPAGNDPLLFAGALPPPPDAASWAGPSGAAPAGPVGVSGAIGPGRVLAALLSAGLLAGFFLPWVDFVGMFTFSGYQLGRFAEMARQAESMAPPGAARPGPPAASIYAIYLIPLMAVLGLLTAAAGRGWRTCSTLAGLTPWLLVAAAAGYAYYQFGNVQLPAGPQPGAPPPDFQTALNFIGIGLWATIGCSLALILTAIAFRR